MKKMNLPFLLTTFMLIWNLSTYSQEWTQVNRERYEELLKPTADFLSSQEYTYRVKYSSFIGHKGTSPVEELTGIYARMKDSFYCNMPGNFSVQKGDVRVQIDTIEKMVVLLPAERDMNHKSWEWAYEDMMAQTTSIEEAEINGQRVVRFILKKGHELEEQRFYLNQKGLLDKIVMYYRALLPIDPNKKDGIKEKARMEIKFSSWYNTAEIPAKWDLDQLISVSKKNAVLLGRFQKYELVEFR